MAERVYAKKSAEEQASQGAGETADSAGQPESGVVDAEFEEVKNDE